MTGTYNLHTPEARVSAVRLEAFLLVSLVRNFFQYGRFSRYAVNKFPH
jgi:hypothetical protein